MNHQHECPECGAVEVCDWGYDDEECAIYDEPIVMCEPCLHAMIPQSLRGYALGA